MTIKLVAYGIAKDILKGKEKMIELRDGADVADLKTILLDEYPQFAKLKSLSFAVGEEYREDNFVLTADVEVVLIPPVSGG
jgi:molybdopterin synthase sulfur carrier subunit